ncbi:11809_t:CDS:2 [Diversispora eburnea]|uniref:11809_t:CDS:1 n=1 Tax=Diversispora eburnea TaxID=1213867 RepID=A0A9N8ZWZ5_9GLOM|nr:11809_t:CDS:2 [Diversispora eburnea]
MNDFDTLLANINRNYIHPPPEIDEAKPLSTYGKIQQHKKRKNTVI